jgi:hypothetical protein
MTRGKKRFLPGDSQADSRFDLAIELGDDVTNPNLLLGGHAGPRSIHAGSKVERLVGIALAIANERQELAGKGQIFLLGIEQRPTQRPLGRPVRWDGQRECRHAASDPAGRPGHDLPDTGSSVLAGHFLSESPAATTSAFAEISLLVDRANR